MALVTDTGPELLTSLSAKLSAEEIRRFVLAEVLGDAHPPR